jgi:hypothetical protein
MYKSFIYLAALFGALFIASSCWGAGVKGVVASESLYSIQFQVLFGGLWVDQSVKSQQITFETAKSGNTSNLLSFYNLTYVCSSTVDDEPHVGMVDVKIVT